ncbi:DUF1361 domain-containing protein [Limosilactobacillus oris]|nr:DUF1361 domain-containing protein [Limosilactobacillus oris]
MAFNTFLGYLPIEIGMLLRRFNDRRALAFWVLLVIWLLFYPNAPYVSTDLFHLSWLHPHTNVTGILKTDPVMWLIFAMMLVCALSCLILGTISLDHTTRQLTQLTSPHHPRLQYCWLVLFMLTASTGIYIGRFLRLHSIYLLFTPSWFFKQLWGIWSWPTVEFILILTGMQLIVYWLLKLTQQASKMI